MSAVKNIASAFFLVSWCTATANANSNACFSDVFSSELLARAAKDQAARRALTIASTPSPELIQSVVELDSANANWLRAIVQQCGWPPKSRIGDEGAQAAWLIAQHADATPDFQVEAAAAMLPRVIEGEASAHGLALLVDRHARVQEIPQTYGLQYRIEDNRMRFLPIRDPSNLDARREHIGLTPFSCHVKMLEEQQGVSAEWPAGVPQAPCPAE